MNRGLVMMVRPGALRSVASQAFLAASLSAAATLLPHRLAAQSTLAGVVTDSLGTPIFSARVSVEATGAITYTDEKGRFRLMNLPAGLRSVSAMRIGFRPAGVQVQLENAADAQIAIRMMPVASALPTVTVHPGKVRYSGRLAGYYKRLEAKSGGYFITRDQIDKENPSTTGQLLAHIPAIQVVKGRGGITGIRMRGRRCWPLVWIDGMPMPAGEVDLDAFVPSSIQGIELYLGSTTAPMAYVLNEALNSCGTILIWSRGPDTDSMRRPSLARTVELEDLVQHSGVFTSENVDRMARLDSTRKLDLTFPPALFATHTPGLVIAEFVVDTLGHVEPNTVGVVSSSAPLFTDAVRVALVNAAFIPALKNGKPVRQLVQQPFEFRIDKGASHPASLRQ